MAYGFEDDEDSGADYTGRPADCHPWEDYERYRRRQADSEDASIPEQAQYTQGKLPTEVTDPCGSASTSSTRRRSG
jgi:hypothetical protein